MLIPMPMLIPMAMLIPMTYFMGLYVIAKSLIKRPASYVAG